MNKLLLHTERLLIRNLKLSDLNDFHAYRSNPEVTKYQGFDVFSLQQAEGFINEQTDKAFGNPGEWVQYAIENKSTARLIGDWRSNSTATIPGWRRSALPYHRPNNKKAMPKRRSFLSWIFYSAFQAFTGSPKRWMPTTLPLFNC